MNARDLRASERFTSELAAELYGLPNWGNGYFHAGPDGKLRVTPTRDSSRAVNVAEVIDKLASRGHGTPVLLRFPQLLAAQIDDLTRAFGSAIEEFKYPEAFHPVFPIKVNQQRAVVEPLLKAGWKHRLGLEVGSLPELLAATVMPTPEGAVTICNGYKDSNYLQAACMAARLGKKIIVVMEKPFEIEQYIEMAAREEIVPLIGIRIRLRARGSGMWEKSGGSASKFGFTTAELLRALDRLTEAGLDDRLVMLHFHIGSQLTEIRKVKRAVREGARVYAKVVKRGMALGYLDVGGGLGIDYDGSKTSSDASMNYTVQEYANDVVYSIAEVCEEEAVPPPKIISESGRMLTAYHAMMVTDVRASIPAFGKTELEAASDPHEIVRDLMDVHRDITVKNYRESYHDALEYRDRLHSLFDLGMISLEDRARGEDLFWALAHRSVRCARSAKFMAEEFQELGERLHEKYICNFSVFQSLPDHWALDALFPIVPIERLDERPTVRASLVDITCDSDGDVEKFIDIKDVKTALDVHELRDGEPYRLAVLLVGAYQETMGDMHNLFGRVHEVSVVVDPKGETIIQETRSGDTARDTLGDFSYDESFLSERLASAVRERVNRHEMTRDEGERIIGTYREQLGRYTYLR